MRQKALLAAFFLSLVVTASGCDKEEVVKAPACDDKRSVDLVLNLVRSRMERELTLEEAKRLDIDFAFVQTTYANDDESLFLCKAGLVINDSRAAIPIVYRSALDDTRENAFTVTVQDF